MVRLAGSLLIAVSAVFTGLSLSARVHERVRMLISVNLMIQGMLRSLSFGMTPYAELFGECTDERVQPFTQAVCKSLQAGADPVQSVRAGVDVPAVRRLLTGAEREYLAASLSAVAQADIDGAKSVLSDASERLGEIIAQARQSEKSDAKVNMTLSVYIGAAAAVLLL